MDNEPLPGPSSASSAEKRKSGGIPSKDFADMTERGKRQRTSKMRDDYSTEEISFAAKVSLRSNGAIAASQVVQGVMESPTRAVKYKAAMINASKMPSQVSPDEALSLIVETKFTTSQYKRIRENGISHNSPIYPSYDKILDAKKNCYPKDITITETRAEVKLQSLLNHTCRRMLLVQKDFIKELPSDTCGKLNLIVKWGFDGSSGQSEYKQRFSDENSSDANILLTSIVPLQLSGFDNNSQKDIVIWKNPRPSSPRFCRPIRLQFLREDKESSREEKCLIDEQIASLEKFFSVIDGKLVEVTYELACTMIDGKVCNAVTDTSSAMRCYLCNATSKQFNNIDAMKEIKFDDSKLQFGMSTLHCWIRFFECLLHVGYKKDVQQWQSRGNDTKEALKTRKALIQNGFKDQLNLLVDRPKQGAGNSNDGNTARRFFENWKISAVILGLNPQLLERFYVILQVLSSGFNVNIPLFDDNCTATARLFVAEYPWYYMPTTVHKVLIHGAKIIQYAILPIGQYSEEAQEARNKDVRNYRLYHARKCSRTSTMEDMFHMLLISSDPFISSFQKLKPKKGKSLSPEALALLSYEKIDVLSDDEDGDDATSSSDDD